MKTKKNLDKKTKKIHFYFSKNNKLCTAKASNNKKSDLTNKDVNIFL